MTSPPLNEWPERLGRALTAAAQGVLLVGVSAAAVAVLFVGVVWLYRVVL